jgi:hypothetical protein
MASIRRRNGKWRVQVKRTNQPSLSKSFIQKSDTERWSRMIESKLDVGGLFPDTNNLKRSTLSDLIIRYLEQMTPKKRGHGLESLRLRKINRHEARRCLLIFLSRRLSRPCPLFLGVICSRYRIIKSLRVLRFKLFVSGNSPPTSNFDSIILLQRSVSDFWMKDLLNEGWLVRLT